MINNTNTDLKKVSIVIPVFNGANYLREAIDSALNQTYKNIEVIIVNDGSDDNSATEKIALSYGKRIIYYKKENGGVSSALNFAIEKMTGDYFSWLSHDDLYVPNKIKVQMDFLAKLSQTNVILYSDFSVFYKNLKKSIIYNIKKIPPEKFRYELVLSSFLNGCTLLLPRKVFQEVGLFNVELRHVQDYDLWFRMAKNNLFFHVPEVLVQSRVHANQDSTKFQKEAMAEINKMTVFFSKSLTDEELTIGSGGAPAMGLAYISLKLSLRNLKKAATDVGLFCVNRSRQYSVHEKFKIMIILFVGKFLAPVIVIGKRFIFYLSELKKQ